MSERILIIDDDVELCELVTRLLVREGFAVEAAHNGESGSRQATDGDYQLVVLDVMMPEMNGFDVLRRVRAASSRVPVLMLTARGDEVDRIVGLELGADDYLAKPFNPRELVARIRAILRRTQSPDEVTHSDFSAFETITVGDIEVDIAARVVRRANQLVELTTTEFEMLLALLRRVGQVVTREDLSQAVLGRLPALFDRSVDMHVSRLRKKLGNYDGGVQRIRMMRNVGYIYAATPQASDETSEAQNPMPQENK